MLSSILIHSIILFVWYVFWPPWVVTDYRIYFGYATGVCLIILFRLIYHYVKHPPNRDTQ